MIFDWLKAKVWMLVALAAGAALAVAAWHLHAAQAELATITVTLATERQKHAEETSARERVAREDAQEVARMQSLHASRQQEIQDAQLKQDRTRAAAAARLGADGDSMRGAIASYTAAGGGGEAQGDTAACVDLRNRTATLGELLRQADSLAEEFAGAAELHADQVRSLKEIVTNDRKLREP